MFILVLQQCHKENEDKWKRLSRQVADIILPMLAKQQVSHHYPACCCAALSSCVKYTEVLVEGGWMGSASPQIVVESCSGRVVSACHRA